MRVVLFFDLPTDDSATLREYRKFRKFLLRNGFMMLQKSVYVKMMLNYTAATYLVEKVKLNLPANGLVQVLAVTEKQFQKMQTLLGEKTDLMLDTSDRVVIL